MAAIVKPLMRRAVSPSPEGERLRSRDVGYEERRNVGTYVTNLRLAAGMTQQQLGRALGVRNTYISAIELGRASISPERYRPMADALGVNRKEFAKRLLQHYNPWLYKPLFDEPSVEEQISPLAARTELRGG